MTDEQREALFAALKEVHNRAHALYPRGEAAATDAGRRLRNQLLVVDLTVHLAEEVYVGWRWTGVRGRSALPTSSMRCDC